MSARETSSVEPTRISVEQAREAVTTAQGLLVCAYADQEKCERNRLEGALTLQELQAMEDDLPEQAQILFFCA